MRVNHRASGMMKYKKNEAFKDFMRTLERFGLFEIKHFVAFKPQKDNQFSIVDVRYK